MSTAVLCRDMAPALLQAREMELDRDRLRAVHGGWNPWLSPAVVGPAMIAFHWLGTPVRMMGAYHPELVRTMAEGARVRHGILSAIVHPGDEAALAIHDAYVDGYYQEFARKH
jgi:hypothetical protein